MPTKHTWGDPRFPWGDFIWGGYIPDDFGKGILIDSKHFHAKKATRGFQAQKSTRGHFARFRRRHFMYMIDEEET